MKNTQIQGLTPFTDSIHVAGEKGDAIAGKVDNEESVTVWVQPRIK